MIEEAEIFFCFLNTMHNDAQVNLESNGTSKLLILILTLAITKHTFFFFSRGTEYRRWYGPGPPKMYANATVVYRYVCQTGNKYLDIPITPTSEKK